MKSKYQSIADEIRKKILSEEFPKGSVIPTEIQLQEIYSVSRHTVRQAIAVLVNEGYLRREKGSGTYVKDKYEENIKAKSTDNKKIGVITTYISDYIFPSIIRGIEKTLKDNGYSLILASTNNDHAQEKQCLERMIELGVDGLIVEPTKSNQYNPNLATYVTLNEHNIPLVMINAVYEELDSSFICIDDVKAGYLATKELIINNHKNLLLITKIDDLQGKYRMKGFMRACRENEISINSDSIITYTTETETESLEEIVEHLEKGNITGIVCYNDKIANLLISKLSSVGLKVPEDYSMVGIDNSLLSSMGTTNCSSVNHPKEFLGIDAGNWIIQAIETGKNPENIIYSPEIIRRDSVKMLSKDEATEKEDF